MASQAIGSLFVSLGLDTATFSAGIKQAQGRIEAFATGLNKRLGALANIPGVNRLQAGLAAIGVSAGAALGAGAAAAAVGLVALSINSINTAKDIQNLSKIANASPEEFQGLAHAAQSVGIEQQKLSDILKDMNDRVGDFIATGGGPMKDFFEQIAPKVGVTADQFRKLSGPQAMQLYVDSLEKANVNQQDFTFFMEAMASDSTALVPILRNGGKVAQEYAARLVALGGVMSNETVAKLVGMKNAMTEVGIVIRGIGMQLGAAFAPVIEALARTFVDAVSKGSLLRGMFDAVATAVGWLADVIAALVNIIGSAVGEIWNIVSAFGAWINEVTGIGDAITWLWDHTIGFVADAVVGFSNLIRASGGFGGALSALKDIALEVWGRIGDGFSYVEASVAAGSAAMRAEFLWALSDMAANFGRFASGIAVIMNTIFGTSMPTDTGALMTELNKAGSDAFVESEAAAARAGAAWSAATAPLESVAAINEKIAAGAAPAAAGMTGLGSGIKGAGDSAGGGAQKLTKLQEVMKKLREEADRLKATMGMTELQAEIWEQQREAGVDAASAQGKQIAGLVTQIDRMKQLKDATEEWRDTIKSSFADFITAGGSFKDVLGQIIGKLAEMLANAAFDGLFAGAGGSGILGGALSWFGIGANANGTNDWRGGLTRVNERGGEIMNLPSGTQVIPHDISKRMASDAAGGSMAIAISLSDGLEASILERTGAQTVQIMRASDRRLPDRMAQINKSPRTR